MSTASLTKSLTWAVFQAHVLSMTHNDKTLYTERGCSLQIRSWHKLQGEVASEQGVLTRCDWLAQCKASRSQIREADVRSSVITGVSIGGPNDAIADIF